MFALVGLAAIAVLVARNWLWEPPAKKKAEPTPHWPTQKEHADADLYAAMSLEKEGLLDEAIAAYTRLLEKQPDSWFLLGTRANCYEKMGSHALAIQDLRALAALKKRGSNPYWRIARLSLLVGKNDEARAAAEASIKLDPKLADPYRVLSDLEAERDIEKSVEYLESYLQRAYTGAVRHQEDRDRVEDKEEGTYIQRLTEMYKKSLPQEPGLDTRAAIRAHWHAAKKYNDITPLWTVKYETLGHLRAYLRLAKAHGDPDRERFAEAREMAKRLTAEIRAREQEDQESAAAPVLR
jgi:tetratricopeptide (TPR) repeat protein